MMSEFKTNYQELINKQMAVVTELQSLLTNRSNMVSTATAVQVISSALKEAVETLTLLEEGRLKSLLPQENQGRELAIAN